MTTSGEEWDTGGCSTCRRGSVEKTVGEETDQLTMYGVSLHDWYAIIISVFTVAMILVVGFL